VDLCSYLKVVQGHHYYLNITFAAGSLIAKMVGQYGWRPMVYLNPRGPGEKREIDPSNPTKGLLIFANYVTNWVSFPLLNKPVAHYERAGKKKNCFAFFSTLVTHFVRDIIGARR
jgi:hypothetical protein